MLSRLSPRHPEPLTRLPCPRAERTLIVHFRVAFISPRLSRLVKPTISSLKLYRHSHVVIEEKKKREREKSFLPENVKSGIRSVSKNVPRIMEKLAKTNTRGKSCHRLLNQVTALCSVPSLSLPCSLAFALSPSPSHKILHYSTARQ